MDLEVHGNPSFSVHFTNYYGDLAGLHAYFDYLKVKSIFEQEVLGNAFINFYSFWMMTKYFERSGDRVNGQIMLVKFSDSFKNRYQNCFVYSIDLPDNMIECYEIVKLLIKIFSVKSEVVAYEEREHR